MDWREFYLREVYPRLDLPLARKYPLASLKPGAGLRPLSEHSLLMLVALTGTGKSTTLDVLRGHYGARAGSLIPSRRELADWIAIPLAQTLMGEPIAPIRDRARRFAYTAVFAERTPGGMAAAFSWLRLAEARAGPLLAEGIRGGGEIGYALRHFPRWRIVELTLNPLTRLRRLSRRRDAFDQAAGCADLSFLPTELRAAASGLLEAGEITAEALAIVKAEATNYGLTPFAEGQAYANYHRVEVDGRSPDEVAETVMRIIERQFDGERDWTECQR